MRLSRKLFVLLSCALILICAVLPASAASMAGSDDTVQFSFLQFDYIRSPGVGVFEWPFNTSYRGSECEFSYDFMYGRSKLSSTKDSLLNGSFYIPADNYIALYSKMTCINVDSSSDFEIWCSGSTVLSSCVINCDLVRFEDKSFAQDTLYTHTTERLTVRVPVTDNVARIGDCLLAACKEKVDSGLVLLQNLAIDISFSSTSSDTPCFTVASSVSPNPPMAYFGTWVYRQHLSQDVSYNYANPAYFDISSWVTDTLGGILSFEIAPGFSIDGILLIFLVLAVVTWFLKIIS